VNVGETVRDARLRQGISQRRLAIRAGTSQDAISRIERGVEAPGLARVERLLAVLGARLVLEVVALSAAEAPKRSELDPDELLRESASWNLVATKLELAGLRARRGERPGGRPAWGR
jgi:transcriptional regulator with XRE-family HTH domain